jgi:5-methylcytosine-specific restriction protein B
MSTPGGPPVLRTPQKVRHLTAQALGLTAPPADGVPPPRPDIELLDDDDPILTTVRDLLTTFGGVIFTGPPGTSKSWYAARVGWSLVEGDESRIRFVQFHPSYQYEDFVEGYVPEDGSFWMKPKHLLEMCELASTTKKTVVLVIDELSRGDPGRVFGEALTYLELSKRGLSFRLASGKECSIPKELVILATMNPLDRGVDEVDAALERRFAKIRMDPEPATLAQMLADAGMADELRERVLEFFAAVNAKVTTNPFTALGHTYFAGVSDEQRLRRVWEHQLRFHFEKAYRLDPDGLADVFGRWNRVLGVPAPEPVAEGDTEASTDE